MSRDMDLPGIQAHLLESGHFALEERSEVIARLVKGFLETHVKNRAARAFLTGDGPDRE